MTPTASAASATADPVDVLRDIVASHRRVLEIIDDAFDGARSAPDLRELGAEVSVVLDRLRERVSRKVTVSAEKLLLPLVCLYDEVVLVRSVAPGGDAAWARLQRRDYVPREDGGDVFFEELEQLVYTASTTSEINTGVGANDLVLLLTLYRFCLTEGFAGRYAGAPDRLKERTDGLDRELQRLTPRRVGTET